MPETVDLVLRKAEYGDWHGIWQNLWRHESAARYMLWQPTYTEEEAGARMRRTVVAKIHLTDKQKFAGEKQ